MKTLARTVAVGVLSLLAWVSASVAAQGPAIGCQSDGQRGPIATPTGVKQVPAIPQSAARSLAYYGSAGWSVCAPRGGRCLGLGGSNGSQLIVTPEPYDAHDLLTCPLSD